MAATLNQSNAGGGVRTLHCGHCDEAFVTVSGPGPATLSHRVTNDTADQSELISNFILTSHPSPDNIAGITHALLTELWPVCQTGNSGETDAKTREFLKRVVEILLDHITIQNDRTHKIVDFHSVSRSFFIILLSKDNH